MMNSRKILKKGRNVGTQELRKHDTGDRFLYQATFEAVVLFNAEKVNVEEYNTVRNRDVETIQRPLGGGSPLLWATT